VDSNDTEPASVSLAPGDYVVRASAFGRNEVDVPVHVAAGRVTEVHLDGAKPSADVNRQAAVFGPNGSFVGYRAGEWSAAR
jgi:hypothetical protein